MTVGTILLCWTLTAAAAPAYEEELIFPLQPQHAHSSSIAECPNGDLLACWFQGSGERRSGDVQVLGARRKAGESEWSAPFPMADTPGFPDCNPVLFINSAGELRLFWIAVPAERWEDSLLRYRIAKSYEADGPPAWEWQDLLIFDPGEDMPALLEAGFEQLKDTLPEATSDMGRFLRLDLKRIVQDARDPSLRQRGWMTRTNVVTLDSGRLLLPLYSDGYLLGLMLISDDNGATWRPGKPIVGMCLNQPAVVQKRDGTLVAYMREEDDVRHRTLASESTDEGETWSLARYTDIPNPNSSLAVIRLADARWVMVYNDSELERDTLNVALSDDEGETWKWQRHLEREKGGQFHYPFALQSRDGRIHVSYTYNHAGGQGRSIKHATFNPEWVEAGDAE